MTLNIGAPGHIDTSRPKSQIADISYPETKFFDIKIIRNCLILILTLHPTPAGTKSHVGSLLIAGTIGLFIIIDQDRIFGPLGVIYAALESPTVNSIVFFLGFFRAERADDLEETNVFYLQDLLKSLGLFAGFSNFCFGCSGSHNCFLEALIILELNAIFVLTVSAYTGQVFSLVEEPQETLWSSSHSSGEHKLRRNMRLKVHWLVELVYFSSGSARMKPPRGTWEVGTEHSTIDGEQSRGGRRQEMSKVARAVSKPKNQVERLNRLRDSGCNDIQVLERANRDFYRKTFSHSKAWYVLKDQAKWKEQLLVSQTQESTGSNKKRKSSESSSAQTPTNETPINVEDFECELPNLNENPTPSRQFKGKKKVNSGDSSRSSMRDTLASYAAEKKSIMQAQLEVQKKKDEEYFKFLDDES
ncbi:homeodomain-like, Myb-like domain, Myb/SANT-like DNA-binding domain protein [Artemisia annua]|uniref:Homeodomain-like, Myb-like domain, Myb/SANT-like DNA-binding domain protein n=1 Tax=Artemisia annua TaxID=35608 RepID=A0A2U1KG40_ARTAN|nr:homeodomain-like, Myb-like domain, Myb/SANT-like DNA-binding domain protein [Artemisia annua]